MKSVSLLMSLCLFVSAPLQSTVFVNQAGYLPHAQKIFFTSTPADRYSVIDCSSGKTVFTGTIILSMKNDSSSGITVYKGDFSSFTQHGHFRIITNTADTSIAFSISDSVFRDVAVKSLKGFYFQRCGEALLPQHAGAYAHNACHLADGVFHPTSDTGGIKDVTGGWHDAGDYGKYIVNTGVTIGTMLMAYELFPSKFSWDKSNIPESGNGIPDLLDEVQYELRWMFKMQRWDGGVYCKVTREKFEGFVMPEADTTAPRYIYHVTSAATGDFAGVFARAARVYRPFHPAFADSCLDVAKLAWHYLMLHPSIVPSGGFMNPAGTITGNYGDHDDSDERLWAAAELFSTTGEEQYQTFYAEHYTEGELIAETMTWANVRTLAHLTYLFSNRQSVNPAIQNALRQSLIDYAKELTHLIALDGFQVSIRPKDYYWGCNSEVLNRAIILILAGQETHEHQYLDEALAQLNYIFGSNINNISYVTGIGAHHPMHIHHRPSGADHIDEPVPGLLVGGPSHHMEDYALPKHFSSATPPAQCYLDEQESYASNEICLNWNAALVFVAGYFSVDDFSKMKPANGSK